MICMKRALKPPVVKAIPAEDVRHICQGDIRDLIDTKDDLILWATILETAGRRARTVQAKQRLHTLATVMRDQIEDTRAVIALLKTLDQKERT